MSFHMQFASKQSTFLLLYTDFFWSGGQVASVLFSQ